MRFDAVAVMKLEEEWTIKDRSQKVGRRTTLDDEEQRETNTEMDKEHEAEQV